MFMLERNQKQACFTLLLINYYVELLIDFNGNKFAARQTVNIEMEWECEHEGTKSFIDRILTSNGRVKGKRALEIV
ncbi:CLUMA_CG019737, isoform A [Clunio marinus]|uniref:CLUMA_CG019737, isoform A n=1 Tax=Clunio marinus TaxID=568069 RepID=A0A1J1J338_9DIPT|nr:CLUMA_CG019737, isoform A [Clunio marinus]